MTLEFGNRLALMRKEKGFSQEELAEKLGVSRQAISKWERGEASPDTDNLIALSSLYGISMDELVHGKMCTGAKQKESVHIGFDGIHVENERESVHISLQKGIHVEEGGAQVHVDGSGVRVEDGKGHLYEHSPAASWKKATDAVISLLTLGIYLLLGFYWNLWHPGWLVFFAIPIFGSLTESIDRRDADRFAWPLLVTVVYLYGGLLYALWHPLWVVFLTIPIYYILVKSFKKNSKE